MNSGVYFLYSQKQLQYIGLSYEVWKRVEQHVEVIDFDMVSVVWCDPTQMASLERECIRTYKPLLNVHHNVGQCRIFISFESDEAFKKHLEMKAKQNDKSVSSYIRAALRKISKYKEKELV